MIQTRNRPFDSAVVSRSFRRGGPGRIAQGYASGKIVQYEIEGANGERYMAHEHELRYP
jgi:hypothetical protein